MGCHVAARAASLSSQKDKECRPAGFGGRVSSPQRPVIAQLWLVCDDVHMGGHVGARTVSPPSRMDKECRPAEICSRLSSPQRPVIARPWPVCVCPGGCDSRMRRPSPAAGNRLASTSRAAAAFSRSEIELVDGLQPELIHRLKCSGMRLFVTGPASQGHGMGIAGFAHPIVPTHGLVHHETQGRE